MPPWERTLAKPSEAATVAKVNSSASSVTVAAANAARRALMIYNSDTNDLMLKFGATASATSFSVYIPGGGFWEMQPGAPYTGKLDGIWTAAGSGAAFVTEY